ncbi:RNA 3'-terminal phosphate cyclase [archaeon]|nr:MAG: RNA 3'-terminal phosphate cyclase [archaeon]
MVRSGRRHMLIDGSFGEGGGQVLRTSLALASVAGLGIDVTNIRARRDPPGLRPQHLCAVTSLAAITDAALEGARVGSTRLSFHPSALRAGQYRFDVGTAGSVTLLLQALLVPLLMANEPSELVLVGGTDVRWSPTVDYMSNVTLRALSRLGIDADMTLVKRGYYPRGGGEVRLCISPWERARPLGHVRVREPDSLTVVSSCAGLPDHVAQRQAKGALMLLEGYDVDVVYDTSGHGVGSALSIYGDAGEMPIGTSAVGARGYSAEEVGADAAREMLQTIEKKTLDSHLPDQLVPYIGLSGDATLPIPALTGHLETNLAMTSRFIPLCWDKDERKISIKRKERAHR